MKKLIHILDTIKQLNILTNSFNNFIYYYAPYFELDDELNNTIKHDIKAISKSHLFNRHFDIININNGIEESTTTKECIDLGWIGDIPSSFEIYKKTSNSTTVNLIVENIEFIGNYIEPGYVDENYFNLFDIVDTTTISLTGNIEDYVNQLNESTDNIISKFTYSLHGIKRSELDDDVISYKIIAIAKNIVSTGIYNIKFDDDEVVSTLLSRPIIRNITHQNLRVIKYTQNLPLISTIYFNADNCKIAGIHKYKWNIHNFSELKHKDIYSNSYLFSYTFPNKGTYNIALEIHDKNGNKKRINKK